MHFILILAIIVLLIIIIAKLNSSRTVTTKLENNVYKLNEKLKSISDTLAGIQQAQQQLPVAEKNTSLMPEAVTEIKPVLQEENKKDIFEVEPVEEFLSIKPIQESIINEPVESVQPVYPHVQQSRESWF